VEPIEFEAQKVVVSETVNLAQQRLDLPVDPLHPTIGHLRHSIAQQTLGVLGQTLRHTTILENLCRNCRLADPSNPLAPNRSSTYANIIWPVGHEVAPVSAARQSPKPGMKAFTLPGSLGCGCAALS
jgi:hypothetical protein